ARLPGYRTHTERSLGVPQRRDRRRKRVRRGGGERRGPGRQEQDGLLPRRFPHGSERDDRRTRGHPEWQSDDVTAHGEFRFDGRLSPFRFWLTQLSLSPTAPCGRHSAGVRG